MFEDLIVTLVKAVSDLAPAHVVEELAQKLDAWRNPPAPPSAGPVATIPPTATNPGAQQ